MLVTACGTARVSVAPLPPTPPAGHTTAARIALYLDPQVPTYRTTASTHPFAAGSGYTDIEVTYDLGPGISQAVDAVVHQHFEGVRRADQPGCIAGEAAGLEVGFAKLPSVQVRWITNMFSEGGGASVELALSVVAKGCDGRPIWQGVVTGYGSEERPGHGLLWVNPASDQFRPAADRALAQLAQNLDAALSRVRIGEADAKGAER